MADPIWNRLLTTGGDGLGWEVFHENSKITRYSDFLTDDQVRAVMESMWTSLPMAHAPAIALPGVDDMPAPNVTLFEAIRSRSTPDNMTAAPMSLQMFSAILYHMAGTDASRGQPNRPFRFVPSGGALYPLELFVHVRNVTGLEVGLYYYNPMGHTLHKMGDGDRTAEMEAAFVQPGLVRDSAIQLFQTAVFERSIFKYKDRGYRFVMMEAGHQAQNLSLLATAFGLGAIHVGGYRDHAVDDMLGLDGIAHSTIYASFVGTPDAAPEDEAA